MGRRAGDTWPGEFSQQETRQSSVVLLGLRVSSNSASSPASKDRCDGDGCLVALDTQACDSHSKHPGNGEIGWGKKRVFVLFCFLWGEKDCEVKKHATIKRPFLIPNPEGIKATPVFWAP